MTPADDRTTEPSGARARAPRALLGLGSAVLLGAAAIASKYLLDELTGGDVGYVPYVAAVALAAWYGGFAAGVTCTTVTALGNVLVFVPPPGWTLEIVSLVEQVKLVIYVAAGTLTSLLIRSLLERGDRLEVALAEQERLAAERDALREQDRRALEFRDAFIEVLSHELRTPLTTIYGSAEVLNRERSGLDEAARRELLRDIRDEAERLHLLIEDLLVLSRSERGRIDVAVEPVEPRRVLRRVVAAEATRWPLVRFVVELDDDLPVVAGEDVYVEQVTRNLLANAAKYGPADGVVVLSARHEAGEVLVRVLDDGPGLASVDMERLFDLFYRGSGTARKASGSGIGLYVCSRLVEAMGGRIWALDRPDGGAEFGFALHAFEEDERQAGPAQDHARVAVSSAPVPAAAASVVDVVPDGPAVGGPTASDRARSR